MQTKRTDRRTLRGRLDRLDPKAGEQTPEQFAEEMRRTFAGVSIGCGNDEPEPEEPGPAETAQEADSSAPGRE